MGGTLQLSNETQADEVILKLADSLMEGKLWNRYCINIKNWLDQYGPDKSL